MANNPVVDYGYDNQRNKNVKSDESVVRTEIYILFINVYVLEMHCAAQ